jgi:hypothetical protein
MPPEWQHFRNSDEKKNPSLTLETQTPYESHSQTFYIFFLKKNTGWFSRKIPEVGIKLDKKIIICYFSDLYS